MTTVTLDDALQARIQAVAAPEEDLQSFIAAAAQEMIARRERQAAQTQADAQAKAQAILNGPRRAFDPEATYRQYQDKYDLPDLSHLAGEELIADTERLIAGMPPEKRAAMEREGLL